jgi:EEF1A N-terminal glycine/lysine methyltransferase
MEDSEDIFASSLSGLYQYEPITYSSPGNIFTYRMGQDHPIIVRTPEVHASNWSLHASSIWVAAVFLADHIDEINVPPNFPCNVLELGAGAGLPSLVLARRYCDLSPGLKITLSDYPDEGIVDALKQNVTENKLEDICRVVPYAWGSDCSELLSLPSSGSKSDPVEFDLVIAADTLWSPTTHPLLLYTLKFTLRRSSWSRVYLVAGLHTGRYTIQGFLDRVQEDPASVLLVESAEEREVRGKGRRAWDITREDGEDPEMERRRWVVWIVLKRA